MAQVFGASVTMGAALVIAFLYGWKLACLLLVAIPIIIYAGYQQVYQIRKFAYRDMTIMDNAGKVSIDIPFVSQNIISLWLIVIVNVYKK